MTIHTSIFRRTHQTIPLWSEMWLSHTSTSHVLVPIGRERSRAGGSSIAGPRVCHSGVDSGFSRWLRRKWNQTEQEVNRFVDVKSGNSSGPNQFTIKHSSNCNWSEKEQLLASSQASVSKRHEGIAKWDEAGSCLPWWTEESHSCLCQEACLHEGQSQEG